MELLGKRTETEQTFVNPNGTFTLEQSNMPVRTMKDGQWVELDPTLAESPDGRVRPKATSLEMSFSGGGDDSLISMKSDGHELKLKWPGSLPEPIVAGDNVTYPDVFPDVDLKITAAPSSYTEVLVVKTPQAARLPQLQELNLAMEAPGLNVAEVAGGAVLAKDELGKVIFTGPPPVMWDSRGDAPGPADEDRTEAPLEGDKVVQIPLEVSQDSMKISPAASLVNDSAAEYPLHIDPPFAGAQNGRAMIDAAHPTTSSWMWTGTEGVGYQNYEPPTRKRLIYKMDISGLAGTHIISSVFSAFETWSASCAKKEVQVWKTAAISTSINWNNGSGSNVWLKKVASVVDAVGRNECTPNGEWLEFNVLTAVAEQAAARSGWVHLGLRAASETDELYWKRFGTYIRLSITYNHIPTVAGARSTDPTMPCATDYTNPSRVNQTSPVPHITIVDPDHDSSQAGFEFWYNGGGAAARRLTSVTKVSSSTTDYTPQIDVAPLDANKLIGWRARAWDGTDYSAWSPFCWFIIDTSKPAPPDVTITSGEDVVYSLGQRIDVKITPDAADTNYFRYTIDGEEPTSAHLPVSPGTFSFIASKTGPTVIRAWSYDRSNNQSPTYGEKYATVKTGDASGIWQMDEGTGTNLTDASGRNRPIMLGGTATWAEGDHFDGAAEHKDWSVLMRSGSTASSSATNIVDTSRSFSVSARVKLANTPGRQVALSEYRSGTSGFTLGVVSQDLSDPDDPKAIWGFSMPNPNGSGEVLIKSDAIPYTAGRWVYLTGVYHSGARQLILYVNEQSYPSPVAAISPTTESVGALLVGTGAAGGVAYPMNGQVDDVRTYPGPIDDDAVLTDMGNSSPTP